MFTHRKRVLISSGITAFITIISPKIIAGDVGSSVNYGLPFQFLNIYHHDLNSSSNLLDNLFNGNSGVNLNILALGINIIIIYYIIKFFENYRSKKLSN